MKNAVRIASLLFLVLGQTSILTAEVGFEPTATDAPSPQLVPTTDALTVKGIAPGGSVALFSVAREPAGGIARVVSRHERLEDTDRDGIIRYAPSAGLAARSIWMVVDLATGSVAVATPLGIPPTLMRPHGAGEGLPVQAVANRLDVGREEVDVLVVRPGVGAWAGVVRDGGHGDRDLQVKGRVALDSAKLQPLDQAMTAAPDVLLPGDVLAILDSARLEYWHGRVAGGGK